jgi:hypothetical protein
MGPAISHAAISVKAQINFSQPTLLLVNGLPTLYIAPPDEMINAFTG